ncbi:hypothetical protein [Terasakiella sp. SH-1]|uniref:hypothetical protein n=1 Tax=Terasakiella sp. SH-1 TaxID=2560057 RepID=UPI001074715C|nr:hypothetical protein [Terasakiella sp. SH-1]
MTRQTAHRLSILTTLIFIGWVVWLWVMGMESDQKHVEEVQKPQVVERTKPQEVQQAQVFILPAPPKAEAKKQDVVPVQAPQEKIKPAPVKKAEPVEKKLIQTVQKERPLQKQKTQKVISEQQVQQVSPVQVASGRALLRVLEHGKGPQIEIAWPQKAKARETLYENFQSCFGMENALMDRAGNLFRMAEARGVRWEINMDRYSGFLRQAAGRLPRGEQRIYQSVIRHHKSLKAPIVVRIFPRRVDASLLGGLRAVVGDTYMQAKSIQARYDIQNRQIVVRDLIYDGRPIAGVIALTPYQRCAWRV